MTARKPGTSQQAGKRQLARRLAEIDFALPGSVIKRMMRCGTAGCRCKADPPQLHGPYLQWTRKVDSKTVTKLLSEEQHARYQPWFDNARALRDLVTELETLSIQAISEAEGWDTKS